MVKLANKIGHDKSTEYTTMMHSKEFCYCWDVQVTPQSALLKALFAVWRILQSKHFKVAMSLRLIRRKYKHIGGILK
jgi:hypothetical protein